MVFDDDDMDTGDRALLILNCVIIFCMWTGVIWFHVRRNTFPISGRSPRLGVWIGLSISLMSVWICVNTGYVASCESRMWVGYIWPILLELGYLFKLGALELKYLISSDLKALDYQDTHALRALDDSEESSDSEEDSEEESDEQSGEGEGEGEGDDVTGDGYEKNKQTENEKKSGMPPIVLSAVSSSYSPPSQPPPPPPPQPSSIPAPSADSVAVEMARVNENAPQPLQAENQLTNLDHHHHHHHHHDDTGLNTWLDYRKYLRNEYSLPSFIALTVLFGVIPPLSVSLGQSEYYDDSDEDSKCSPGFIGPWFNQVLLVPQCVLLLLLAIVSVLLTKQPRDAFGAKSEIYHQLVCGLINSLVYYALRVLTTNFVATLWLSFGISAFYFIAVGYPLFVSLRFESGAASFGEELALSSDRASFILDQQVVTSFEQFLRIEECYQAFLAHLYLEFSSENLSFWLEVEQYRSLLDFCIDLHETGEAGEVGFSIDDALELIHAVIDKYIKTGAPYQINICSNQYTGLLASLEKLDEELGFSDHSSSISHNTSSTFGTYSTSRRMFMLKLRRDRYRTEASDNSKSGSKSRISNKKSSKRSRTSKKKKKNAIKRKSRRASLAVDKKVVDPIDRHRGSLSVRPVPIVSLSNTATESKARSSITASDHNTSTDSVSAAHKLAIFTEALHAGYSRGSVSSNQPPAQTLSSPSPKSNKTLLPPIQRTSSPNSPSVVHNGRISSTPVALPVHSSSVAFSEVKDKDSVTQKQADNTLEPPDRSQQQAQVVVKEEDLGKTTQQSNKLNGDDQAKPVDSKTQGEGVSEHVEDNNEQTNMSGTEGDEEETEKQSCANVPTTQNVSRMARTMTMQEQSDIRKLHQMAHFFDDAQLEIVGLMKRDSFRRFKASPAFAILKDKLLSGTANTNEIGAHWADASADQENHGRLNAAFSRSSHRFERVSSGLNSSAVGASKIVSLISGRQASQSVLRSNGGRQSFSSSLSMNPALCLEAASPHMSRNSISLAALVDEQDEAAKSRASRQFGGDEFGGGDLFPEYSSPAGAGNRTSFTPSGDRTYDRFGNFTRGVVKMKRLGNRPNRRLSGMHVLTPHVEVDESGGTTNAAAAQAQAGPESPPDKERDSLEAKHEEGTNVSAVTAATTAHVEVDPTFNIPESLRRLHARHKSREHMMGITAKKEDGPRKRMSIIIDF